MLTKKTDNIIVDGVSRPIHNVDGRLIAQDIDGLLAFWRFYANGPSDRLGRPIVVYHGACGFESDEFSYKVKGINSYSDSDIGFFFGSADVANCFANEHDDEPSIIPAYVSLQNPKYVQGATFVTMLECLNFDGWQNFKNKTLKSGYDGVIVRTDSDALNSEYHHQFQSDNYIAFHPEQIKSAIGNPGTYNRNTASITDGHGPRIGAEIDMDESTNNDRDSNELNRKRFKP